MPTTKTLAESQWLLIVSRLSMLATPVLLVALVFFGRFWIESQFEDQAAVSLQLRTDVNELSDELPLVKERTKVLENNQDRGRQERIEFQRTTTDQLAQIITQQQAIAQQQAAMLAMLQAQQRELDRRR